MENNEISCTMCGARYDPDAHISCQSCPLAKGCSMVCCPNCGYQTINTRHSRLAQLASFFLSTGNSNKQGAQQRQGDNS